MFPCGCASAYCTGIRRGALLYAARVVAQFVVQFSRHPGGLTVDRVMLCRFVRLITGDEGEAVDVFMQVFEHELVLLVFVQAV